MARAKALPRKLGTGAATLAALLFLGACLNDSVAPGPVPTLVVLSGAGITDTIGAPLTDPLVVQALDAEGAPLIGLPLRLAGEFIDGEPSLSVRDAAAAAPAPALDLVTGTDGLATIFVSLGDRAGPARLLVTHPPTGTTRTVSFQVLPGAAVSVHLAPRDTVITTGTPLRPRRYVFDRAGNAVARPLSYTVTGPLVVDAGNAMGNGVGVGTATGSIDGQSATVNVTVVPDGRVVVGGWARTGLRSSKLDGSEWILRDIPGAILWVDTAPRGRGVVFSYAHVVAGDDVFGPYTRLTPANIDVSFERWPRFSDDGAWVYFEAVRGSRTEIWRTRPQSPGAEQVTATPLDMERVGDRYPAVSHGGDLISYSADRSETSDVGTLEVRNVRTGAVTALGEPALSSRWSPDDAWIAFVTPDKALMRIRPDGTDLSSMTPALFTEGFDWSPDGQYIIGLDTAGMPQLLVIGTGEVVSLGHLSAGQTRSIAWYDDPN